MGNRCFVPLEGGEIEIIPVPVNLGGGVDWSYVVPPDYEMTLLSLRYTLTNSALVASRRTALIFANNFDVNRERIRMSLSAVMVANDAWTFDFSLGSQRIAAPGIPGWRTIFNGLPFIRWQAGTTWGSDTVNLKPGDIFWPVWQVVVKWRV